MVPFCRAASQRAGSQTVLWPRGILPCTCFCWTSWGSCQQISLVCWHPSEQYLCTLEYWVLTWVWYSVQTCWECTAPVVNEDIKQDWSLYWSLKFPTCFTGCPLNFAPTIMCLCIHNPVNFSLALSTTYPAHTSADFMVRRLWDIVSKTLLKARYTTSKHPSLFSTSVSSSYKAVGLVRHHLRLVNPFWLLTTSWGATNWHVFSFFPALYLSSCRYASGASIIWEIIYVGFLLSSGFLVLVTALLVVRVPFVITAEKLNVTFFSKLFIIVLWFFSSFSIKKITFFRGWRGIGDLLTTLFHLPK